MKIDVSFLLERFSFFLYWILATLICFTENISAKCSSFFLTDMSDFILKLSKLFFNLLSNSIKKNPEYWKINVFTFTLILHLIY